MKDDDPMMEAFKGMAVAGTFIAMILMLVSFGALLFQWLGAKP